MIKYCIFDLDGTLLDTLETIRYYMNTTLTEAGYRELNEDECRMFVGDGARVLMRRALNSRGEYRQDVIERLLGIYTSRYDSMPLYLTEAYPGIRELIEELHLRGITPLVLSNKPETATSMVVGAFFRDAFALVRGGRDGVALKPSADAPLAMLSELGADASECAFVGDTSVDILTAKNMGAALSIGVLWGFRDREELLEAGADILAERAIDVLRAIIDKNQAEN